MKPFPAKALPPQLRRAVQAQPRSWINPALSLKPPPPPRLTTAMKYLRDVGRYHDKRYCIHSP